MPNLFPDQPGIREALGRVSLPVLLFLAVCAAAGQDEVLFRSGVALVRVDAGVIDAGGAVLTELKKEDFQVFDQSAEQAVVSFNFEQDPLDLILLFDLSGSMRGKLLRVVRAVELGFHELKPADRVCVMTFGPGASEILPFTSNPDAVNQAIILKVLNSRFGGEAGPERAAEDAARRFRREKKSQRRRAVLVVTDKTGASSAGAAGAVRELWASDAVLGELVIGKSADVRVPERGTSAMAEQTGGGTVIAGDPGAAFQQSLRLLRRRYALYYALPAAPAGTEHRLEVRLSPEALKRFPGARLRARTGYITP